jgi:hypothetical protein
MAPGNGAQTDLTAARRSVENAHGDTLKARPTAHPVKKATPDGPTPEPMGDLCRRLIGCGLLLFAAVILAHLFWAWSIAERLVVVPPPTGPIRVHWLGVAFTPTVTFIVILIVALAAMAGSTAATANVFANRAGYQKLEKYWVWWYVLRPAIASVVAVVAYVALKAGLVGGTIGATGTKGLAFAAVLGGLTGLFTDTMLVRLRGLLGQSPFNSSASDPSAVEKTGATDPASP